MPERRKGAQAVECLADIRKRGGASSGILVFESEQRDATTAHAARVMTLLAPWSLTSHTARKYLLPNNSWAV